MAPTGIDKPERVMRDDVTFAVPLPSESEERAQREKRIEKVRLLWGRRRLLARAAVAGIVVAALVALLFPSHYKSTTRLMPPDQSPGAGMSMLAALAGKAGGSFAALGAELLGLKTNGDLFVGILKSRTVQDDIISKFDLRRVYWVKRWEDARKMLDSRVSISTDRRSGIITIEVSDADRQRAQQMAQEFVAELNRVVTSLNTSAAHRERVFLEGRLAGVQGDLESSEQDFSQFASKNTTIDIQTQGKAMIEAGAALAGQLVAAQTELEGLRQIYTDNNVRVRALEARVEELRRQLQKLGGRTGDDPAADQDAGALYPPLRKLPLLGVTYADLYRRMKVQEAVFETLTQEYELAKVEEAKETPSVKILDQADFPERRSPPSPLALILIGALLAPVLAGACLLGKERWSEADPDDPGKLFASEVFHTIQTQWPLAFSRNGSHEGKNGNRPSK